MKSLNIKLPIATLEKLSDNGELNSIYLTGLLQDSLLQALENKEVVAMPVSGLTTNYTFKTPQDLHRSLKIHALIDFKMPMNELAGRLIQKYYRG